MEKKNGEILTWSSVRGVVYVVHHAEQAKPGPAGSVTHLCRPAISQNVLEQVPRGAFGVKG